MSLDSTLLWVLIAGAAIAFGTYLVHGAWQTLGAWRVRKAGPRPMVAVRHVLWRDPGDVAELQASRS